MELFGGREVLCGADGMERPQRLAGRRGICAPAPQDRLMPGSGPTRPDLERARSARSWFWSSRSWANIGAAARVMAISGLLGCVWSKRATLAQSAGAALASGADQFSTSGALPERQAAFRLQPCSGHHRARPRTKPAVIALEAAARAIAVTWRRTARAGRCRRVFRARSAMVSKTTKWRSRRIVTFPAIPLRVAQSCASGGASRL